MNSWTLMGTKRENNGFYRMLQILETSVRHLKGTNLMITYGVTKVSLKVFDKKNPRKPDRGRAKEVASSKVSKDEKEGIIAFISYHVDIESEPAEVEPGEHALLGHTAIVATKRVEVSSTPSGGVLPKAKSQ